MENINPKIIQIQSDSYSGNHTGASTLAELNNSNKTVIFSYWFSAAQSTKGPVDPPEVMSQFSSSGVE